MEKSFDNSYKNNNAFFGVKPSKLVLNILKYINKGKVLDLGMGYGKNSIFLAKNNFDVSGIDISKEGINSCIQTCKNLNVNVDSKVQDINAFEFKSKYDVILAMNVLQFLKIEDIKKIILKMKSNTNINELNVISVFTKENGFEELFGYLFNKNELKEFYSDWEILEYEEFISDIEVHGNGKPHTHAIAQLIARKLN
jgi:tellurite methyltransferase